MLPSAPNRFIYSPPSLTNVCNTQSTIHVKAETQTRHLDSHDSTATESKYLQIILQPSHDDDA